MLAKVMITPRCNLRLFEYARTILPDRSLLFKKSGIRLNKLKCLSCVSLKYSAEILSILYPALNDLPD